MKPEGVGTILVDVDVICTVLIVVSVFVDVNVDEIVLVPM